MGWVTSEAPSRNGLASCVQCGLCLPHCPTFRLTGNEVASPRGRLSAMSAVASDTASMDETFEEMMWFCLQCRACEAACPSLVPFGALMEGARAEVDAQRPSLARSLRHAFLGRLLPLRAFMAFVTLVAAVVQRLHLSVLLPGALRRAMAGLRPLSFSRPRGGSFYQAHGAAKGTAGLLSGCVVHPWFSDVNAATIELLRRAGWHVAVPADQTCCGALAAHDGAASHTRRLASRNEEAFSDVDIVVANAAGCGAHLKEYEHWGDSGDGSLAQRARDVSEVLFNALIEGRLPHLPHSARRVAMQDPCHLRHAQRIAREPRAVVEAAGYDIVELDTDGLCCGAAGIYSLLQPEASRRLGEAKASLVAASGARIVASANAGCEMQLRQHLGRDYRIAHPVELYWEALRASEEGS